MAATVNTDSENEMVEESTSKRRTKRQKTNKGDANKPIQTGSKVLVSDKTGTDTTQTNLKTFFPVLSAAAGPSTSKHNVTKGKKNPDSLIQPTLDTFLWRDEPGSGSEWSQAGSDEERQSEDEFFLPADFNETREQQIREDIIANNSSKHIFTYKFSLEQI